MYVPFRSERCFALSSFGDLLRFARRMCTYLRDKRTISDPENAKIFNSLPVVHASIVHSCSKWAGSMDRLQAKKDPCFLASGIMCRQFNTGENSFVQTRIIRISRKTKSYGNQIPVSHVCLSSGHLIWRIFTWFCFLGSSRIHVFFQCACHSVWITQAVSHDFQRAFCDFHLGGRYLKHFPARSQAWTWDVVRMRISLRLGLEYRRVHLSYSRGEQAKQSEKKHRSRDHLCLSTSTKV